MKGFKTSKAERFSYLSFFLGQNTLYIIIVAFLMLFYTDEVGISATAVGTLFLAARIWDAINDLIIGIIIDKVNFKAGKFKPWIKFPSFVLPFVIIAVFLNLDLSPIGALIYAYITYIVFGMLYTVSDVPIFALSTTMTDNLDERNTLLAKGRLASVIAMLFVHFLCHW